MVKPKIERRNLKVIALIPMKKRYCNFIIGFLPDEIKEEVKNIVFSFYDEQFYYRKLEKTNIKTKKKKIMRKLKNI